MVRVRHRSTTKSPLAAVLAVLAVLAALTGCDRQPEKSPVPAGPDAPKSSEAAQRLADRVTGDHLMAHLRKLQEIADAHDGNRAAGTPGYDASLDFVVKALQDKGFDVQTPEFTFRHFHSEDPELTVDGSKVTANPLEYTIGTPPNGVTARVVPAPVDDSPGCTASDYDNLPVSGAIALVSRGECQFGAKLAAAQERGAVALIIADNIDEEKMGGTLGQDNRDVKIPVVSVSKADGATLRGRPGTATLKLDAGVDDIASRNVIAQTKTGSTQNVVMLGSHLDSVKQGPGINDNGSGSAAVLETALLMGSSPDVDNAVRFAFWGAEEYGLIGSKNYIRSLNIEQLKDIALYLNFDMIGSPNPGFFTYDGNQSAPRDPELAPPNVPEGSAGIERMLTAYLKSVGIAVEDTSFNGRSDYAPFTYAGIPAGGLFTGAEEKKTKQQADLWGGEADASFDPKYHKKGDTIDNINRDALEINGRGVAFAAALYAGDLSGRNGVPIRDDRTRHVVTELP